MGWFDDAKDKATAKVEEAKDAATEKAAEKAASAALAAAGAAASRAVGGFFEGVVSSAEAKLADAEASSSHRRAPIVQPSEAAEHVNAALEDDAGDPLGRRMREAAASSAQPEPVVSAAPVAPSPAPSARRSDPFEDARRALALSREARGLPAVDPQEERRSADPVTAALEAAAEARAHASSGSALNRAREESAREQLAAMKAGLGGTSPRTDDDDTPEGSGTAPKKRSL